MGDGKADEEGEGAEGEEEAGKKKKVKTQKGDSLNLAKREFLVDKFTNMLEWGHTIVEKDTAKESKKYVFFSSFFCKNILGKGSLKGLILLLKRVIINR